jgi:hypothetical protein
MASIGSLLTGTPATLNADLLPSDVGVYVDSLNGLRGTVSVASGGAGIGVAVAGQNVAVSNTGVTSLVAGPGIGVSGATGAVTVSAAGTALRDQVVIAGPFDPYVGTDFLPFTTIAIPAAYQSARMYRVTLKFQANYVSANLNPEDFKIVASAVATFPGLNSLPADVLTPATLPDLPGIGNGQTVSTSGICNVSFTTPPTPNIYLFFASDESKLEFQPGTISTITCDYVLEPIL